MNDKNHFRLDELPPEHPLRQHPFQQSASVPDGYFDTLPTRVQARVARKSRPGFSVSWSWQRTAASLAGASLLAVLVWQTLPQRQESLGSEALAGVDPAVITAYLDDQGVDAYELADTQQINSWLGNDTTPTPGLNVAPTDIQQYIDEYSPLENPNLGT